MESATPAKLPVWKTARECYRLTFRHLGELLRFAWPWLLVLVAVSGALYWGLYPLEQEAMAKTGSGSNLLWMLTLVASTAIGAFIAVPWHRLLLLGETQDLSTALSCDRRRLTYFLQALALLAVSMPPIIFFAAYSVAELSTEANTYNAARDAFVSLALLTAMLIAMAIMYRLSLVLPARALDQSGVGWKESWRSTRGNTWRMLVTNLVVLVPYFALFAGTFYLYPIEFTLTETASALSRTSYTFSNVIMQLVTMSTGMLCVTFLSLAYRHFFGIEPVQHVNT